MKKAIELIKSKTWAENVGYTKAPMVQFALANLFNNFGYIPKHFLQLTGDPLLELVVAWEELGMKTRHITKKMKTMVSKRMHIAQYFQMAEQFFQEEVALTMPRLDKVRKHIRKELAILFPERKALLTEEEREELEKEGDPSIAQAATFGRFHAETPEGLMLPMEYHNSSNRNNSVINDLHQLFNESR